MSDKFQNKYRISSIRLPGWDYSKNGYYFITICVENRELIFGEVKNKRMFLNKIGDLVQGFWLEIPHHFPFVMLDEFVVMPNHIHGILIIDREFISGSDHDYKLYPDRPMITYATPIVSTAFVETLHCNVSTMDIHTNDPIITSNVNLKQPNQKQKSEFYSKISPKSESLATIIRSFKSICTKTINKTNPKRNFSWQERFFEEILRDDIALKKIRDYIKDNPAKWDSDRNNCSGLYI